MSEPATLPTSLDVAERLRISYRQLDHWVRLGYLPIRDHHPGSGVRRVWSPLEIQRAEVFAALIHAGFYPAAAADVMLSLTTGDEGVFVLWAGPLTITGRFTT